MLRTVISVSRLPAVTRRGITTTSVSSCQSQRKTTAQADNMMDIGVRKIFNSDQDMFRESARKFYNEEVKPYDEEWELTGVVPRELWRKAGSMGLIGISTPAEYGGHGGTMIDAAIAVEEQMYVNAYGPGFPIHSHIVMPYITKYGTDDQRNRFLPGMTDGSIVGSLAMTEPGAGSDLQALRTNAKKDGDDWILNGSKTFISNGILCDAVVVVALTNPQAKSTAHGLSLFIVEDGMKGFSKGKNLKKIGMKAQDTAELFFDDVRLPASSLLGEPNKGFYFLMDSLPEERLLIGIGSTSHSEWMFEETRAYVKNRTAFGKPVIEKQVVNHKLAEMKTAICITRHFIDDCLEQFKDGRLDPYSASMAKYWSSDLQNKVAYECLQLHGGWGFMNEMSIGRAYTNARVQTIYGGSNEIMKELIARQIKS